MSRKTIVLGSRGSKLALWQTEHIRERLMQAAPEYDYQIKVIHTKGDKILDVALSKIGDKGLFTKELERELVGGGVDLCVHSMKDMSTQLPEGLAICGVPERANPCDVVVATTPGLTVETLPQGARVATGSLRRVAQLRRMRPDIETCEMRGNIDTRIGRVVAGEFDAAVLAASGIMRLGLEGHISSVIPATTMVPAVGQGALAVEIREDDEAAQALCRAITDEATMRAVKAERIVLRDLEGGCQVPMGAHAQELAGEDGETLFRIDAFVASLDGSRYLRSFAQGAPSDSASLARAVVADLRYQGAEEILEELR